MGWVRWFRIGDVWSGVGRVLDLLVAIPENRSEAREEVLDGGGHLAHAHHVHDPLQPAQDRPQHLRQVLTPIS